MNESVPSASDIARDLPRYRIEAELGRGGMSIVYLAEDTGPLRRKRVALKVLAPFLASEAKFRQRFESEAQIVANLVHPNVIPIYDFGEAGGLLYLVMHYVEGSDLRLALTQGALPPARVARIVTQVAGALDAAHRQGLVHRDVKPANVLLERAGARDEHAYLSDFGITKNAASGESLTATGQFIGTIDYIAPEQIEGRGPLDARADVYALGAMVYHCLSGEVPYARDTDIQKLFAHLHDDPPSLREIRPDLPPKVDEVVRTAMAKDRDARYSTSGDLAADLEAALSSGRERRETVTSPVPPMPPPVPQTSPPLGPPTPPPPMPQPQPPKPDRGKVVAIAAGALVVFAGLVVGALMLFGGGDDDEESPDAQPRPAAFPNEAEQALLRTVPTGFRDSCDREDDLPQNPAPVGAVRCSPNAGAETATFLSFSNAGQSREYYDDEVRTSPVDRGTGGDCFESHAAEHEFRNTKGDRGRVLCFQRGDAESVIVWTQPDSNIVVRAFRGDDRDGDLYEWWVGLAGRDPNDNFPLQDEQTLIAEIPVDFDVDNCDRNPAKDEETEVAALVCTPSSGADTVFFTKFTDRESMVARYNRILGETGVAVGSGTTCPSEDFYTFTNTGAEGGRVVCYFAGPTARVTWTNNITFVLTEAIRNDGDSQALLEWWRSGEGG